MAGSAANANLWTNADVYIGPLGTLHPINVVQTYAGNWKAVGLLDGDEGFTEARDDETSERYAWGGLLVRTTRTKHKRTIKFTMLEDNADAFGLINPGSTRGAPASGLTTTTVKVPVAGTFIAMSLETRDGYRVKRRNIVKAEVTEVGEIKHSETDVTAYEVTVTIYPDSGGVLYTDLDGVNGS